MAAAGVLRLAVVADDLTGAADAAAPFAARGLAVSVALGDASAPHAEVLAVLTDNRRRPAEEAERRTRAAVAQVRRRDAKMLFVKIDSVLRGQVCSDVSGALAAWPAGAVATPAFPAQGRTVRDGALFVHGERAVARVAEHFPPGVRVVDAETHDDLVTLARAIVEDGCVAVGSGGLSRALAEVLVDGPIPGTLPRAAVAGVLVVAGTPHPVTRSQVAELESAGAAMVLCGPDGPGAAITALRAGRRVVLACEPDGEIEPATALASTVAAVVAAVQSLGLVLTGGDTALAVATELHASELRLLGEVTEGPPLNKEAIALAGHPYPGHTEILAELTGTSDFAMMLTAHKLRVVHVTTHVGIRQMLERVTTERVLTTIRLGDRALRDMGVERPSVGVAGLNPHAGEGGLFGDEEQKVIIPAIEQARAEGIDATGPWPADTLFGRAVAGDFDVTVAMFHDQGHIAVKVLGFETGVNATIGLPIVRTSVDHGTAFDIAGTGTAGADSLVEAVTVGASMAQARLAAKAAS